MKFFGVFLFGLCCLLVEDIVQVTGCPPNLGYNAPYNPSYPLSGLQPYQMSAYQAGCNTPYQPISPNLYNYNLPYQSPYPTAYQPGYDIPSYQTIYSNADLLPYQTSAYQPIYQDSFPISYPGQPGVIVDDCCGNYAAPQVYPGTGCCS